MLVRYVKLWPWPLTCWPWTFTDFGCHEFKLCNFMGWVRTDRAFSGLRGPNFTKLNIGRSSQHCFFQNSDILLHFQMRAVQSWVMFKTTSNFVLLTPPPLWKLGERWARSLYQLLKLYLWPNLRKTFHGHPLRGCWARCCIDKKKVHG